MKSLNTFFMKLLNKFKLLNILLFLIVFQITSFELYANKPSITFESEIRQQGLNIAIQKAIQTRRLSEMDRLSKERGSIEEEELAHEIAEYTADYTADETHESSIRNFIEKNFGFSSNDLYCVAPERITKREFVIIDKENALVVKVFPQIPKHYFKIVHELSGHEAFEGLHIKSINLVNFLALGKYSLNGVEYILLGMSYAKGQEIRNYIEEIYDSKDLIIKQKAIHSAKEILQKLGGALGDIHLKGAIRIALPEGYLEAFKVRYSKDVHNFLTEYQERGGEHREKLQIYFENLLSQYNLQTAIFSIFHGDAHLANFLYDKDNDCITVVDSVKSHLSVDSSGLPISNNYVHDIVKIENAIVRKILSHEVNDELINELIEAFHQGYDEKTASLINPLSLNLDKSLLMLKHLASSLKQGGDENKKEYLQRSLEYYEKKLNLKTHQH
ncbi:MAG: hypothetical protein H0X29_06000 [Parachlamydiaceae bacterium]|nr:hypothetical protein [Parachlamydiaceae bacterium]